MAKSEIEKIEKLMGNVEKSRISAWRRFRQVEEDPNGNDRRIQFLEIVGSCHDLMIELLGRLKLAQAKVLNAKPGTRAIPRKRLK